MARKQSPEPEKNAHVGDAIVPIGDAVRLSEVAGRLAQQPIVAFDTEFIREKTYYPKLGLIQVADREQSWLIDPLLLSAEDIQPLLRVFTDPAIIKVAHSSEQDQSCLYYDYGIVASPVLDTSIAAALTGFGDQIGLAALLKKLLGVNLPKAHTRSDWLRRPLPQAMASYALLDVEHLVEAAEMILADLDRRNRRDWAMELSAQFADPARYEPNPDAIAHRLASNGNLNPQQYAVLRSLTGWRESRACKSNVPRKWLADDQVLVKLALASPSKLEDLSLFRGLRIKADGRIGEEMMNAISEGRETRAEELAQPPKRPHKATEEGPALSVLKCFLALAAQEQKVAPRFLIDAVTMAELLRNRKGFPNVVALRESKLLSDGVIDLIGEEMVAVLNGELGLRLSNGRVERCAPGNGLAPSPEH
jgi:ribonuclease D